MRLNRNNETGAAIDQLRYAYNGTNRLQSMSDAFGTSDSVDWDVEPAAFRYDPNGNLVKTFENSNDSTLFAYDHRNLPLKITLPEGQSLSFRYSSGGQRYFKQTSAKSYTYILDGSQQLAVIKDDTLRWWNIFGAGVEGRLDAETDSLRYYLKDNLGSTRVVVNSSGDALEGYDYYPFGLLMPKRTTTASNTLEKFTGHELDDEAGLNAYYMISRYYDPATLQFWSTDPILGERSPLDLLALNPRLLSTTPYGYVFGNPLNLVDPNGRMPQCPECDNEEMGFLGQLRQTFQFSVKDIELPLSFGFLYGQSVETVDRTVETLDKGIEATGAISEVADAAGLGLAIAAVPTEGATLPAAGIAEGISLGADITGAALMVAKTKLTGRATSEVLLRQSVRIGVGLGINKSLEQSAGLFIKRTGFQTGVQFRGAQSGRFITNLRGFSITTAAVGLPTAISLYINAFLED